MIKEYKMPPMAKLPFLPCMSDEEIDDLCQGDVIWGRYNLDLDNMEMDIKPDFIGILCDITPSITRNKLRSIKRFRIFWIFDKKEEYHYFMTYTYHTMRKFGKII